MTSDRKTALGNWGGFFTSHPRGEEIKLNLVT